MKVMVCEFPDEFSRKKSAWRNLVSQSGAEQPDTIVLPEMPFCEWIFVGDSVDNDAWRRAIENHDEMLENFDNLSCTTVMASRPIEHEGHRFNEAFIWSKANGYQAVRRKWYLPDVPVARETLWFSHGDRKFDPVTCGPLHVGFQLCSEIMFPEHAREIGFAGAHLIAHPRAGGTGQRWRAACELSAVISGCYLASANRRSYDRDLFSGASWLFSPEAALLAETSADRPFVTAEIELSTAERAKKTYPRDMQRAYFASSTQQPGA